MEMPDGVRLATDVHRPRGGGPCPTVLVRTPYSRGGLLGIPLVAQARLLVRRGYAVVIQDVRGRFGSEGRFLPAVHEAVDGAATVAWIRDQPWADGSVGAMGSSYLGGTALAAAAGGLRAGEGAHVDALAVGICHAALGLPDARGVRQLETSMRWLTSTSSSTA